MVSKNNIQLKDRYATKQVPHYGIRKLSVGVASVLLSTTLYMGVTAHADTIAEANPQPTIDQPVSTATGNATDNVQLKPTADQSASMATNSATPKNEASAKAVPTVLPKQPANATDGQPTAVTSGSQPATNFNVESDNNGSAAKPAEQSTDPATLMTNFAVTEQPVDDTHNPFTTTLPSKFTWAIHYTDDTGKKLLPDSVITHDYTRTDTGDQMGNWSYVPDSVKVTGTPNAGSNIDTPTFKFDQAAGGTTFDFATWYAVAASIDGYIPNYGSVVLTDQLSKNPESLHATATVDSGTHEFTFVYTKQPTKVTINYVDDEQGEKVVGTGTVSGKSGTDVTITPQLPKGYMLTPNKDVPSTYTVTDAADQAVTIHVQKQFVDLSDTDPQAKQTRTITLHYVYGAGDKQGQQAFDDAVLDVYYRRTATLDRSTNQTTYGDWTWDNSQGDTSTPGYHVVSGKWTNLPQSWATVTADVPSIKGWYADLGQNDPANTNHVPANTWVFPTYNNGAGAGVSDSNKGATAYLDGYGYEVSPTHTIKYVPNQTTVTVNYVDDDNNKANVGSQHWDGTIGQHIDLTLTPPTNYVLSPGWANPSSYDFDGTNSMWYTVHVKHATQDVTDQQSKDQVTKTETLTRKHLYGPGPHEGEKFGDPDIIEVPWHRTAMKDLVTGKVNFGDWHVVWDKVKQLSGSCKMWGDPEHNWVNGGLIAGHSGYSYLGVGAKAEAISADGTVSGHAVYWNSEQDIEKHPTIVQYYGREKVRIPVKYFDFDTKKPLENWGLNLHGDDYLDGNTVTLNLDNLIEESTPLIPNGYKVYPNQTLPTTYKIDTVTNNGALTPIVVYMAHQHVTVQPDDPKTTADILPDNLTKNYPSGVAKDDLTKTITRKVTITSPDGKQTVTNQTVTFTRNATVDEVTGDVTYGSWSEDGKHEFATVDVPSIPGYTATGDVANLTVTPDSKDTDVTINYTANQRSTQIVFVDKDGKTVDTVDVNGKTGETVETNAKVPDKWKLVDNETVPSTITFSADTPKTLTVHVEHKIETRQLKINTNVLFPRFIKVSYDTSSYNEGYSTWITDDEFNDGYAGYVAWKNDEDDDDASNLMNEFWLGKPTDAGSVIGSVQYDLVSGEIVKVNNGETLKFGKLFNYPSYDDVANGGSLAPGDLNSTPTKETFTDMLNGITHENLNYKVYASANLTKDAFTNKYLYGLVSNMTDVLPFTFENGKQYGSDYEIDNSTINNSFSINFNDLANNFAGYDIHEDGDGSLSADKSLVMPIVYQPYISKTVTRTINVTNPDGTVKTIKQTAEINQNVGEDFDWKVHHGDYLRKGETYVTDNNWSAYEVPTINGYTASQNIVNAVSVDGNTTDQTVNISYTANKQSVNVNYVDVNDGNKVVHTTTVNGVTDGDTNVPNELPAGYKLVDGQSVPQTIHFNANNNDDINVKVQHSTVTVTPDSPKTSNDKLPDNPSKNYPSGVAKDDLSKTVTRKVTITSPNGKQTVTNQTVTFTRTATVDEVTGLVAYDSWSENGKHTFTTVDVPNVPGYTATGDVSNLTVTPDSQDTTVTISYTANKQQVNINYVDINGGNKVVHTTTVNGVTNGDSVVSNELPAGYKLVDGQSIPKTIHFNADNNDDINIKVQHTTVTVTPNSPKTPSDKLPDNPDKSYPSGVSENDLNKTITRTIKVTTPDGQTKTVAQTVKLTRNANVDEVTGEVTYGKWSTGQWDAYDVPNVAGYTASQTSVAATPVDENTKNQTVDVSYTPNKQSTVVKYVDDKGQVVHTTTVNGTTDQTVKVPSEVPAGWTITNGQVPSEITFGADGHEPIEVTVAHQHVTVEPDHPQNNGTNLPDNPAKTFNGVEANDLNKTITRTIKVTTPDGQTKTVEQTVHLTRTADVDEVTGEVTYGKWTTGEWDAYEVPALKGYTASQTSVAAIPVDGNTKDQTINISYTANSQTTHINYVDDNGKIVHTTIVNGVTGQTVKVPNEVPAGWTIVKGQVPSEISFGPNGHSDETITISHQHVTVDPDYPQTNGTKLPDNSAKTFNGVEVNDLNKTVTRTIKVITPDGQTKSITQTAKLTRTADVDEVTGEVTYGNWTSGEWNAYEVPSLSGYTASQTSVEATQVDENTKDQTVEVSYTPNKQTTTIKYVDDKGQTIHTTTVDGVTDQTVKVPSEVPAGWAITKGKVPSEITFGADGHEPVVITVAHQHVTVDSDYPQTNGMKLPDNPAKTFNGVEANDLNKTIIRIIKVTMPDGQTKTVAQTAKLTRTADVDEVTGEVTYGKWTTGEWDAYEISSLEGYTASQLSVAATPVNENTKDQTVDVIYTPNKQTTMIKYVDDKGEVVHTTTVDGVTDQTVKVPSEVPAGWAITKGKVPSQITFGADGHEPIEVTVAHRYVTVTPDHPQNNGTKLPDNPVKTFNGVEASDLNKTITRTIKVTTPDGQTKTVTQTAKLTRTADVDEVTGEITYGKWTTGQWNAYEVPALNGYTASQTSVEATPVDENAKDQTVEVSYTPNSQSTTIKYVDDKGQTIHTTTVNGVTNQTVKVPSEVPAGWTITKGKVPSEITFGVDGHEPVVITVGHQHVTVDPDHPQNNGTKLPDNPAKTFEGVEANDLNKTITRTIKVTTPDGKVTTTKQIAKLTRTADVDEVTGEVTYGNWTTGEWAAYDAPSVAGYTPSQATVAKESVTATSKDTAVDITYLPMQHQISVEYVDDDDHGKIVKTDHVSGKTDQTITVTPSAPANYDLVNNGSRTYTVTSDDAQAVQIHVKHHQVATSENKMVIRTINIHTPHDGVKTIKQIAELTRKVTTDQVTGEKTYDDWTTGQWEAYTPEVIPGYTPSINEVPNTNVDGSSSDQTVDVTYTADPQKVEIVYVDDTKGGAVVKTDQVAGKTDETVKVTPDVPVGYKVVGEVPGSYTLTANGHQMITVHLAHQTKTTSEDKTVTRTINFHMPHDGIKTIKQTAMLTRTVTTDQVTGEKTYGDWSATLWDHYAVPAVAGYVPSIKQVAQQVVNGTTTDQMIDVTYSSGEHTTHINYVDGDGNTVHTTTIKGQTDGTAQVPNETPAGWTVVGEPVPTELAFGPDGHADVTVTISHKHVTVTPDQPKTSSDKLPDNPAKTYPSGVGHDDLNKTITRTIKITTPDSQTKTTKQAAKLIRTADIDEVTGKVTYGNWTTGVWSSYTVLAVPGYTSSQSEVPATKVTNDTKDQTVTIGYTANDQTTTIDYVDHNGKTVHTTVVNGHTDQTVKVPNETPAGWTITTGQVPAEITFGSDGHDRVTVTVDHQHVTVTSDKPQVDGTKLPDNPSQIFHGVAETDLNKTITRTIKVTTPAGKTDTIKQATKLTRTADVDEVTGEVTYGKWTTGAWSSYAVPTVAGYTPSQGVVDEAAVYADTTDQTVKITYTADSHTTHINYVDENGNVVHTTTVTGQTDQTVKVPNETPAGWTITTGQVPGEVTFGPDGYTDVTITVDHRYVTVTPDHPQADGTKLPDNPALTFHDVDRDDLNKTVTRIIKLNVPGQDPQVITQTARLTRTATVDEVTGEVTYGDWTSGRWDVYEVPVVDGYTASQTTIPAVNVTSETTSQEIVVDYVAVPTAQTTPSNNQTDENQVTPEKVATGTVQETKQDAIKNSAQSTMQDTKQLPQTGNDNRAGLLSLIGSSLMASLAIFGLSKKKKHEN